MNEKGVEGGRVGGGLGWLGWLTFGGVVGGAVVGVGWGGGRGGAADG